MIKILTVKESADTTNGDSVQRTTSAFTGDDLCASQSRQSVSLELPNGEAESAAY